MCPGERKRITPTNGTVTTNAVVNGQSTGLAQSVWSLSNSGIAGSRYYYTNTATIDSNGDVATWNVSQQSTSSYGGSQFGNLVYSGSSPSGAVTTTSRSASNSTSNAAMTSNYGVNGGGTVGGGVYKSSSSLTLSTHGQAVEQQTYLSGTLTSDIVTYSNGVGRMQTLIDDLLSYSRVSTRGKAFEPCDCRAVLKHAQANLEVAINETQAVFTHDELPVVKADAAQLTHLFQNLLTVQRVFR